ncbi:MAG: helix-turn-helix transcriptional regulator [Alphaproteobacteria bacterium]|nr:helix-turn-helix transcriptional regulator [Alphaproteobacteria bacterium]
METTHQPVNYTYRDHGGKSARLSAAPVALIELENDLDELRVLLGASGYAVCRTRRYAREESDRITIVLSSLDEAMRDALSILGPAVQRHMEKSLLPFSWPSNAESGGQAGGFIQPLQLPSGGPDGVGFPVRLGVVGNGFVAFFGSQLDLSGDRIVECHRAAYRLLRGVLRLDVNNTEPQENLNDRELQCLQLAADGYKSEAIAAQLQLSVHTVNAYLGFAAGKLNAVNRVQAIAKAIRLGLIG